MSENKSQYDDELNALVGKEVVVAVSVLGYNRNHYFTQMSVNGTLESNGTLFELHGVHAYRVLLTRDTYCYFTGEDVYLINPLVTCDPIIHIKIDTLSDSEE